VQGLFYRGEISTGFFCMKTTRILKKDSLGSITLAETDGKRVVCRNYAEARLLLRPLAYCLARREAAVLKRLASLHEARIPGLIRFGEGQCVRSFIEGEPLNTRKPANIDYYENAAALLDKIHACGVVHNDLEKPENWLVMPDGAAGVVDFQLALVFKNRNRLFRLFAREDIRHLVKQKHRFAPATLSEREKQILDDRSRASRFWSKYYKPVYRFITRKLLRFSDRDHSKYSR
jgi:RIO-like serine/threonine protein kinase